MHRQDVDAVLAAQVEVGQPVADEPRMRPDDALHDGGVLRGDRLQGVLAGGAEQHIALVAQARCTSPTLVRSTSRSPACSTTLSISACERDPVADHVDHPGVQLLGHTGLIGRLADQRRAQRHQHLGQELALPRPRHDAGEGLAIGQDAQPEGAEIDDADDGQRDADRRDLEQAERRPCPAAGRHRRPRCWSRCRSGCRCRRAPWHRRAGSGASRR